MEEQSNTLIECALIQSIKHYFMCLRESRGHNPDGSPIDLELLLAIKLIAATVENPVITLFNTGIIIVGSEIALNAKYLADFLSTCRSRINTALKNIGWDIVTRSSDEKYNMLSPLVERKDARNWTLRHIPESSQLYTFINDNSNVRHKNYQSRPSISMPMLSEQ